MAQYFLQTLKGKTNNLQKKPISPSGQGWFKAQFDTSYQVIDQATGLPPKKLSLKKKGKSLVVEVDGNLVTTIRNFYGDVMREVPRLITRLMIAVFRILEPMFPKMPHVAIKSLLAAPQMPQQELLRMVMSGNKVVPVRQLAKRFSPLKA